MRCSVIIYAVLVLCSSALPQDLRLASTLPNQFEIGRHTFIDIGPPFDFYELFIVRSTANGASVERITLTPAGDECISPAKLQIASASISDSVAAMLGSTNPCTIPEKALRRELKRRKKSLVFSGAEVVMQVQCGTQTRLIRSKILDRDMFDAAPNTPEHTSWTMRLLGTLDRAVGPGAMDQPIFPILGKEDVSAKESSSVALRDINAGKYDALFQGAPDKPSELYRAAQNHPPPPSVRLLSSVPIQPEAFVLPEYPPLARMVGVEGVVSFKVEIDAKGAANNLTFESGHALLREAVKKAVSGWRFPKDACNQQIQLTIEFALNCHSRKK